MDPKLQHVADTLDEIGVEYKKTKDKALVVEKQNIGDLANKLKNHGWDIIEPYSFKKVKNIVLQQGDLNIELFQRVDGRKDLPVRVEISDNPDPLSNTDTNTRKPTDKEKEIEEEYDTGSWSSRDKSQVLFLGGSNRSNRSNRSENTDSVRQYSENSFKISRTVDAVTDYVEDRKREKYQKKLDRQLENLRSSTQDQKDRINRELEILRDDLIDKLDDLSQLQRKAKKEDININISTRSIQNFVDGIYNDVDNHLEKIKRALKQVK